METKNLSWLLISPVSQVVEYEISPLTFFSKENPISFFSVW